MIVPVFIFYRVKQGKIQDIFNILYFTTLISFVKISYDNK